VVYESRCYTYAEIAALVDCAGSALRRAGVERGDRVLIVLPDSPEFVAAYFGAIKIGAVAVPTSTALRPADYAHLTEESQAKMVVSEPIWPADSLAAPLDCAPTSADDPAFWPRCTDTPTGWRHAKVTLAAYWASARTMSPSPPRSCSTLTVWATA
jgi:acyl-CoA synthetase (AMP-forming)/AMP-acid ligase II